MEFSWVLKPSWLAGEASILEIAGSTFAERGLCKALLADWFFTTVL
ncbi:hypothetical protein [Methylomonas albis]|nr:hypothetical protein [Methylomonas albis]